MTIILPENCYITQAAQNILEGAGATLNGNSLEIPNSQVAWGNAQNLTINWRLHLLNGVVCFSQMNNCISAVEPSQT